MVSELDPYRYSLLTGTDAAAQFGRDLEKILHYEPIIQGAIKPTTDKGTSFTLAPIVPAELGGYFGYNLISDKGDIETAQKLSNAVLRVQAGLAGPRETVWLANQFAGSDQLKKELGADTFSKFVSELKKGNVEEAMKLLPEGNAMKQYLGKVKEQGVSIEERSDRESITLYRWGAGIILKFDEQEYKLWRKLNTRTESNPLYVVILAVGVGYSD